MANCTTKQDVEIRCSHQEVPIMQLCPKRLKHTPRECLELDKFPKECSVVRHNFDRCRAEILDKRTRLRGHRYESD
ncbi:hypothetical protein ACTXT7_007754 [Hymenolepis weldensis]